MTDNKTPSTDVADDLQKLSLSSKGESVESIAQGLASGRFKKVIVMSGAGISVSAGIPDFRTPGTGLYSNLEKYNLPRAEAIFEISYFKQNPKPFCTLAKELYPGDWSPTPAHYFLKLLSDKKVLLRAYTQNIDGLELLAGVPVDEVMQAHGGFSEAKCISCQAAHSEEFVKTLIFKDEVPRCTKCNGLVKPCIVFFGEGLPERFGKLVPKDFPQCDLLIVMGTSLKVQPFASLIDEVPDDCPRLLINAEPAGVQESPLENAELKDFLGKLDPVKRAAAIQYFRSMMGDGGGFNFDGKLEDGQMRRDVFLKGYCDAGVKTLADKAGWAKDLEALISSGYKGKRSPGGGDAKGDGKSEAKGDAFMTALKSAVETGAAEEEAAAAARTKAAAGDAGAAPAAAAGAAASPTKPAATSASTGGAPSGGKS